MAFSWTTFIAGGVAGILIHSWASDPANIQAARAQADGALDDGREFGEGALEIIREQEEELRAQGGEMLDEGTERAWSAADEAELRTRRAAAQEWALAQGKGAAFKKRFKKALDKRVEQARERANETLWAARGGLRELKPGMMFDPSTGVVVQLPEGVGRGWRRTMQRLPRAPQAETSTLAGAEREEME